MARAEGPSRPPDLARFQQQLVLDRRLRDAERLADALRIGPGDQVLELGCGTGRFAERLGRRVGARGEVLGLDAVPMRVQVAHQHCELPNVRFQIGRAQDLSRFPDGCFSAVLAVHQLHRWADPVPVLAACRRLLAPGGRLGLVDPAADPPHPVRVVQQQVLAQPLYESHAIPPEAQEWPVLSIGLEAWLAEAGFEVVSVQSQPDPVQHGSVEAAIEYVQASAWGEFLDHLPAHLRALARADIVSRLAVRASASGLGHAAERLLAVAVRHG